MKQAQFQKLTAMANDYDTCGDNLNSAECLERGRKAMTEQIKHTPGPWHIGCGKTSGFIYNESSFRVASITNFHGLFTEKEASANAMLIASAPDMLMMLKNIVAQKAIAQADIIALIAKAEGRLQSEH